MLLTLGALLADVPHSRPVQLMGTATDQAMIDRFDLQRSRYEGPTGIVGVLHDASAQTDLSSASLWAAVPAYASQVPSPKAALALVERACEMLGCPASTQRLVAEAGEYDARVSAFVGDDDDLIGYVSRLESLADSGELDDDDDEDEDDEASARADRRHAAQQRRADGRGRALPARSGRRARRSRRGYWPWPRHIGLRGSSNAVVIAGRRSPRTPSGPTTSRRRTAMAARRG